MTTFLRVLMSVILAGAMTMGGCVWLQKDKNPPPNDSRTTVEVVTPSAH